VPVCRTSFDSVFYVVKATFLELFYDIGRKLKDKPSLLRRNLLKLPHVRNTLECFVMVFFVAKSCLPALNCGVGLLCLFLQTTAV